MAEPAPPSPPGPEEDNDEKPVPPSSPTNNEIRIILDNLPWPFLVLLAMTILLSILLICIIRIRRRKRKREENLPISSSNGNYVSYYYKSIDETTTTKRSESASGNNLSNLLLLSFSPSSISFRRTKEAHGTPSRLNSFEQTQQVFAPIHGVFDNEKNPLVSIDRAIDSFPFDFRGHLIGAKRWCQTSPIQTAMSQYPKLSPDMAMSIWMYTTESDLHGKLNQSLRSKSRSQLRIHFFPYLRLLLTALDILKQTQYQRDNITTTTTNNNNRRKLNLYRGVRLDLRRLYPEDYQQGKSMVWWDVTSTTDQLSVLTNPDFLGMSGERTLFQIYSDRGVAISQFSDLPMEHEYLLPPATPLRITGILPKDAGGQTIITCEDDPAVNVPLIQ